MLSPMRRRPSRPVPDVFETFAHRVDTDDDAASRCPRPATVARSAGITVGLMVLTSLAFVAGAWLAGRPSPTSSTPTSCGRAWPSRRGRWRGVHWPRWPCSPPASSPSGCPGCAVSATPGRPPPRLRRPSPACSGRRVPAPEPAGVVPVRRHVVAQDAHGLERGRDDLGAVGVLGAEPLALGLAPCEVAVATAQPAPGERQVRRERDAVEPGDRPQQGVLLLAADVGRQLAQPGALAVAALPRRDGLAQVVQLHPAVVVAGPVVAHRAAELGVPHERRQVVEDDGHPDVVDRGVARRLDDDGPRPCRPGRSRGRRCGSRRRPPRRGPDSCRCVPCAPVCRPPPGRGARR